MSENAKCSPEKRQVASEAHDELSEPKFRVDPSLLREPSTSSSRFECGEHVEKDEEENEIIVFYCNAPGRHRNLEFHCRDTSCGVLIGEEPKAAKSEYGAVDPNFFDQGYTLAGRTGFQVWPGSRLLVEALLWPSLGNDPCSAWQQRMREGAHVLELGAGVGVVGATLAAVGAQVLLTDLPTLVENSIQPNLIRNEQEIPVPQNTCCPEWLRGTNAVRIGNGWAGTAALDWTHPVKAQLSQNVIDSVDIIIASDCVWLVEMLNALLSTVEAFFTTGTSRNRSLLMSFQRRDPAGGKMNAKFTSVDRVLDELKARRWDVKCLGWRPVVYQGEAPKEVFVFEISPQP